MILTSITLSALLATQGTPLEPSRPHRSFRFVYDSAVAQVPAGAKDVRLWIPLPVDTPDQTITNLSLRANSVTRAARTPGELKDEKADGLSWTIRDIQGGSGRSICFETDGKALDVELAFDVTRFETHGGGKASPADLEMLKKPNRMIPLDGKVAAVAASMKTPPDPMETARALYMHVLDRMRYDKPEGGDWGRGDAEWACDSKFGNCTDFHSYFMGLARTKGLAARFEMGFPIPAGDEKEAKVGGYHCWAYVWVDGHGWVPVDISEADKHPEKAEYFFETLDADRVMMTGGRDIKLEPSPTEGNLNFFVYPYAEVDGKKFDGVTKGFKRINL